jgi:dUTPase
LVIPAGGRLVKTDRPLPVRLEHMLMKPRSGLALKKRIDTGVGVIDADYRDLWSNFNWEMRNL